MRLENTNGNSYIMLEPGDHNPLRLPEVVCFIPVDSPVLDRIEDELECNIDDTQARFSSFRQERSGMMFQVHGDLLALRGVRDQIHHFREMVAEEHNRQLYGSLHDEPPMAFASEPEPEPVSRFKVITNSDFDPHPPSIA